MNFGFLVDQDTTRYCYLRLRRLKAAVKDAKVVTALAADLEISEAAGKRSVAAIERRIEELRVAKSSLWHEVPAPEVLAALIFKARKRAGGIVDELFGQVPRVQDLAGSLVSWLNIAGLTPYAGAATGTGRANVVGYRGGEFLSGARVVGIEALNDANELDRALDETKTSQEDTHASYIACTPALAAEFLWAQTTLPRVSRWDPEALRRRLQASGCGLLLVEGDAVAQALLPTERKLDNAKLAELAKAIRSTRKIEKQPHPRNQ